MTRSHIHIDTKRVEETLQDENWIESMHEELNQFVRNDMWEVAPKPENVHVIGTKWIFKNKTDEDGEIIRIKSRLVAQGYTQVEGVDFWQDLSLFEFSCPLHAL